MLRKRSFVVATVFGLIMLLYAVAIFSTFGPRSSSDYDELVAFASTFVGGSAAFVLGYLSVIVFGGVASLGLVEFISRLNRSQHTIEIIEETKTDRRGRIRDAPLLYISASVFIISLALALNIHYLHTTTDITYTSFLSSDLHYLLDTLDIFLKPASVGSLRYSIEIIPIMVFFVVVAGVVPSMVLPYFRKFRVTSVNAAPFHKDILFSIVGTVLGLTVVLSLVDIIYGTLTGNQPHYYNYVLPTMVGFSLHYSLGNYLGRDKAEAMVEKMLKTGTSKRVFQGKVTVQETPSTQSTS